MLDPRGVETRGESLSAGNDFIHDKGFFTTEPSNYIQAVYKKNTVKELLMMKRQKRNGSRDEIILEHRFKSPKREAYPTDVSPHLLELPAPLIPGLVSRCAPANGCGATPGGGITLFHWQIQQEEQKVGAISAEQLHGQDGDGDTFLHIAVAQGKRALAFVLAAKMSRCGSLEVKEHHGQTVLQIAAATNQHLIVQDLLSHGAQISTRDAWGRSPLHVCAEKGHFLSLQSISRALLGSWQMIDVEMLNYEGLTPLHAAILQHGAAVKELRSVKSSCPYATIELVQRRQAFVECVRLLLLMGASCGTKRTDCLHMAAEEANVELLSIFLEQPPSVSYVNEKTFSGNTALHIVSSLQNNKSQVEAVKLLMRHGADPGIKNLENETPSHLVCEGNVGEKVQQILKGKNIHA